MKSGVTLSSLAAAADTTNVVDRAIELGSQAERLGLDSVWFPQLGGYDAVTLPSAVGRAVAGSDHQRPVQLGIGLGAKHVLEPAYGLPYPPPIIHATGH